MTRQMTVFTIATLSPAVLIALGAISGGVWVLAAFLYMILLSAVLDLAINAVLPDGTDAEFPGETALSVVLVAAHFGALALTLIALSGPMPLAEKAALFVAMGLFAGQISNSNAHELIHKRNRLLHRLGMWVYISLLYGHHTSTHVLIHHVAVATDGDPNSAPKGRSFYRFVPAAWGRTFRLGYQAEAQRLIRANRPKWRHPYVTYLLGAALCIALAGVIGNVWWYLALAAYAQVQLLLSDYIQHYGLRRKINDLGKAEPVANDHSWNSPHWLASAMMLNAPRHSDHHVSPMRSFGQLRQTDGPQWPYPLPVMATIALFPPLWRRVMHRQMRALGL
jgi:alkane 1-monooxygenase